MKPKQIMFGVCPECGEEIIRRSPIDSATCECHNPPIPVPLKQVKTVHVTLILTDTTEFVVKKQLKI